MGNLFHTSLLREKFILNDISADFSDQPPVIALSNRMALTLIGEDGKESESFVVRTQNMHSCVRLCAAIAKEFAERGPIASRLRPFGWSTLWRDVTKGYERDWNPDIWGAIYHKGRPVFQEGNHHPFLDIIEQCDAANKGEYEQSVEFAEAAFEKAGKAVRIEHDSNIALIVKITEKDEGRCGIMLRGAARKTTFSFTVTANDEAVRAPTLLTVCAAFLEGVQLTFQVGMINKKRDFDLIAKYSDEDRKGTRCSDRLINLNTAISRFEQKFNLSYRPERPDLKHMVKESEAFAARMLKTQLDEQIAKGLSSSKDWVK